MNEETMRILIANLEKKIKEQETQIDYISHHDHLTNIPNRLLFENTLSDILTSAKQNKKTFAVMMLDLDRFKNINDTLGHEAGDYLLKQVTARFQSVLRKEDLLARLGGDEFGILLHDTHKMEDAALVAKKIIACLTEPFLLEAEKVNITPSIGIAVYPFAGESVSDLIRSADKAMYQAKKAGKNTFQFYTPEFNLKMAQHLHIDSALHAALNNNEFYLCYQPIYHLNGEVLFGVEVLLRWNHPEFSKIPIEEIIMIAEESGLITQIGDWVMNEAFQQYRLWKKNHDTSIKLAINLSPRQLDKNTWFSSVKKLMQKHQIEAQSLIFELTETDVVKNMKSAQKVLSLFSEMGAQIFIDDFGMGHSSFKLLKNLPIAGLKIDKSTIQATENKLKDRNLVKSLFMLAKNMGFIIVAEGIETKGQLDYLKTYAEGIGQGYYLSTPLLAEDIEKLLKK